MSEVIGGRLRVIQLCEDADIVSKNMGAILKNQIVVQNENLNFIFKQFESNKTSFERFIDSINVFIEKEIGYIFDQLFVDCTLQDAKQMSKSDRDSGDPEAFPVSSLIGGNNSNNAADSTSESPVPLNKPKRMEMSLTYGEIEYKSFYSIMRKLDLSNHIPGRDARDLVFYDLGSGTARAVIVAKIMYNFKCCKGIELLKSLHRGGEAVVNKYFDHYTHILKDVTANIDLNAITDVLGNGDGDSAVPAASTRMETAVCETASVSMDRSSIELIHGSITDTVHQEGVPRWWEDGDVVFANSTCFDSTLMEQISVLAGKLRPGSIIITFTKSLNYTTSQHYNTVTGNGKSTVATSEYQDGVPLPLSNLKVKTMSPFAQSPLSDDYSDIPPSSIGTVGGMSSLIDDLYPDTSRGNAGIGVRLTAQSEPVVLFELVEKTRYKMSWGPATVFIHRRLGISVPQTTETNDGTTVDGNIPNVSGAGQPTEPYCLNRWRKNCTDEVRSDICATLGCNPVLTSHTGTSGNVGSRINVPRARVVGTTGGACDSDEDLEGENNAEQSFEEECVKDLSVDSSAFTPGALVPGQYIESRFTAPNDPHTGGNSSGNIPQVLQFMLYVPSTYLTSNYTDASLLVYLHGASCRGKSFEFHRSKGLMQYLRPCTVQKSGRSVPTDEWDLLYTDSSNSEPSNGDDDQDATEIKSVAQIAVERNNCLVLAPLCPSGYEWKSEHITKLVVGCMETLMQNLFLSKNRFFCTGNSMGGLGCWMLAARYPQLFRAIVPICGGGNAIYACLLIHLPM